MRLRARLHVNLREGGEVKPGEEYDLPDAEALEHVSRRWAVAADAEPEVREAGNAEVARPARRRRWRAEE